MSTKEGERMEELRLRPDGLHWRELDDEVIALDAERSQYVATNPAGTLLWEALAAGATRGELAQVLVRTYGLSEEQAAGDAGAFLAQLEAEGLRER